MRVLVVLLAVTVATASANVFGTPGFSEGRIINGYEAHPGEAPFIISLQSPSYAHFCAGSLITPNVVLTAAHCMSVYAKFFAVAGAHDRSEQNTTQIRATTSARQKIHESYGGGVGPYDVGLIFLEIPFNLTTPAHAGAAPVATIALPNKQFNANTAGKLFGWGRDNTGALPQKLQTLDVNIIDADRCKAELPKNAPIHATNICTFTNGTTDGACNGDSGGPLVSRKSDGSYQIVGIVSWGYTPCAITKYPSVYTNVASFLDWIDQHIHDFKN